MTGQKTKKKFVSVNTDGGDIESLKVMTSE